MTDNKTETTTEVVKTPKSWKTMGTYNSFEDADLVRNQLLSSSSEGTLIKVRRCGPGGTSFKVKQWTPVKLSKKKKSKK